MATTTIMYPSNNTGITIVSPSLSNNNYHSWSQFMTVPPSVEKQINISRLNPNSLSRARLPIITWHRSNTMFMVWKINSKPLRVWCEWTPHKTFGTKWRKDIIKGIFWHLWPQRRNIIPKTRWSMSHTILYHSQEDLVRIEQFSPYSYLFMLG